MILESNFHEYSGLIHLSSLNDTEVYSALFNETPCILRITSHAHPSHETIQAMVNEFYLLKEKVAHSAFFPKIIRQDYWENYFFSVYDFECESSFEQWSNSLNTGITEKIKLSLLLVEALVELHTKGLTPGYIAVPGILISKQNKPCLIGLDNLITHHLKVNQVRQIQSPECLLTLSPEMTGRTSHSVDSRSDIYSLGCLLFFLLTGRYPIQRQSPLRMIHSILSEIPGELILPEPLIYIKDLLSQVLNKALEKDPHRRYQNSKVFLNDWQFLTHACLNGIFPESFIPALQDRKSALLTMDKLYGRDKQLLRLHEILDSVRRGHFSFTSISGETGMGKTPLAESFLQSIPSDMMILRIKFNHFSTSGDISLLTQILIGVVQETHKLSPNEISWWKNRFSQFPEESLYLIQQSCPLSLSFLPDLSLAPTEIRTDDSDGFLLLHSVIEFLSVLAELKGGILLFLDDLQWIDLNSTAFFLEFIRVSVPRIQILYTLRDKSDDLSEGASRILQDLNHLKTLPIEGHSIFQDIKLKPLEYNDLFALISKISPLEEHDNKHLAETLYRRTQGIPLLIEEYIQEINHREIISFNRENRNWELNLHDLSLLPVFDSMVDMFSETIERFPKEIRNVLAQMSHLGSNYSQRELCEILQFQKEILEYALNYCISIGILIRMDLKQDTLEIEDRPISFINDKIQQAALGLLKDVQVKELHYRISEGLLSGETPKQGKRLHTLIRHIQLSEKLPESKTAEQLFPLFLQAAKEFSEGHLCEQHQTLIHFVEKTFDKTIWDKLPQESFDFYHLTMECSYRLQLKEEGDKCAALLLEHVKNDIQKANIKQIQMTYSFPMGEINKALDYGIEGLKLLKFKIHLKPGIFSVLKNFIHLQMRLRSMTDEDIMALQNNENHRGRVGVRLYAGYIPPAFNSGQLNLFAVAVLKSAHLTLDFGLSPESAAGFMGYSILLAAFGNLQEACRFGRLALEINQRFKDPHWRSMVYTLYLLFSKPWMESWDKLDPWIDEVVKASHINGDRLYQANAILVRGVWTPDINLKQQITYQSKAAPTLKTLGQYATMAANQSYLKSYSLLAGLEKDNFEDQDEQQRIQKLIDTQQMSAAGVCKLNCLRTTLYLEMQEEYETTLKSVEKHRIALTGSCYEEELNLFSFIISFRLYSQISLPKRIKTKKRMKKILTIFKGWSKQNPLFTMHLTLCEALWAQCFNPKTVQAGALFEKAIELCDRNHFLRYRGLFREIAGEYFLRIDQDKRALRYLQEALDFYGIYQAQGVVQRLKQKYPHLRIVAVPSIKTSPVADMDIASLHAMYQSLTRDMDLDNLIRNILGLIIENSGAQRGVLIMVHLEKMEVLLDGERGNLQSVNSIDVKDYKSIYSDLLYSAYNSKQTVIEEDRGNRSYCCFPFVSKNEVRAMVYLENSLSGGIFTREHLSILDMLSSTIVVSLENANLYSQLYRSHRELEKRVETRTRELDQANIELQEKLRTIRILSEDLKKMALKDELTELHNRRYLNEIFPKILSSASREHSSVALLLLDLDHFKKVNDTYGHGIGDKVLKRIARSLKAHTRQNDVLCRLGGEEFLVLLPRTSKEEALALAEKLRVQVQDISFADLADELKVTLSIGVSITSIDQYDTEHLLRDADDGMYRAKRLGRNRIEYFSK